jgi:hypothetical protein
MSISSSGAGVDRSFELDDADDDEDDDEDEDVPPPPGHAVSKSIESTTTANTG